MNDIAELVNKYGFPIVAAGGMGYLVYYIWQWVTTEIKPVIGQANGTLIALIDRIRLLDNDLIRLNEKVATVLELRGKSIEHERIIAEKRINRIDDDDEEYIDIPIGKRKATKAEIDSAAGDD
jgi:hypothetical protein